MKVRSALYVDGFNLYHAINDLRQPHLKWLNLWALGEDIIPSRSEELVKVAFCSAFYRGDLSKRIRHEAYINALKAMGVTCIMGHYVKQPMDCKACNHSWEAPTEKETDINIALSLYDDAYQDVFDKAYLVTADSDQAATAKFFKARFEGKELITVSPPNRSHSKNILDNSHGKIALKKSHIERAVFPGRAVMHPSEADVVAAVRPKEYEPPEGWIHPKTSGG